MRLDSSPVAGLIPYALNARTHDDAQIAQIAASIREFGFNNPILIDEAGTIIAGHGRVLAARVLGLDNVPTITLSHLSELQRRAYVIADNRLALSAGWDDALLRVEFEALREGDFDLSLLGFTDAEMTELTEGIDFTPTTEDQQPRLDEKVKIVCPNCGHEFTN